MNSLNFTCTVCGKQHAALPPIVPDFTPEEVGKRKTAWLDTEDKLAKSPGNVHLERDAQKAWFAYGETMSNGVPRIPETITTVKRGGAHSLVCVEHEQLKDTQSQQATQKQCGGGYDCSRHGEETDLRRQTSQAFQRRQEVVAERLE